MVPIDQMTDRKNKSKLFLTQIAPKFDKEHQKIILRRKCIVIFFQFITEKAEKIAFESLKMP